MTYKERARKMVSSFGSHKWNELEAAKIIAQEAIERYGDLTQHEMDRMRSNGIWADHCAVQAALAAIRMIKAGPDMEST